MACGITYSRSNACGWEDGWPPRLGQTHTPGSSEVESALYNVVDMGLPRGVVISALGGRGKNLNPIHLVQSLPRPPFHSSDICSFFFILK